MKITYSSAESFYRGIYKCVKLGMTFEASHDTLIITLTGGF